MTYEEASALDKESLHRRLKKRATRKIEKPTQEPAPKIEKPTQEPAPKIEKPTPNPIGFVLLLLAGVFLYNIIFTKGSPVKTEEEEYKTGRTTTIGKVVNKPIGFHFTRKQAQELVRLENRD